MVPNLQDLKPDIAFWTGFYEGDDYFVWASNKAYLDMNRTMTFREVPPKDDKEEQARVEKQRENWRDEGTNVIRQAFSELTGDFEAWHKTVCKGLIQIYGRDKLVLRKGNVRTEEPAELTYGQAQKWLNMTLKYIWLLNRVGLLNEKDSAAVTACERQFHVPLDSYILRYAAKQNRSRKEPFAVDNGLPADFSAEWKAFGGEWSKITDSEGYYEYQKKLARTIKEEDLYPLQWELIHWHRALDYYG